MKHSGMKTADEVLVSDPASAMQRLREATRQILTAPKTPKSITKLRRKK